MAQTHWHVYMVRCGDGSLYTGITTDLERRLGEHNSGKGAAYTRSRLPVSLVYREEYMNESDARKREAAIKKLPKSEKERIAVRR
ncbi:GIY-YIG nuclease family protein [Candidatus Uhrbacteria bacterium]|nr:GIY-YIG nuclease family protein [Candidatus Uhrbacteria bacterium]